MPDGHFDVAPSLDTSILPLDERAQRKILDHVIAVGDEAETVYLEVKSGLDLASKVGVAKIAKFLLGAANRLPHEAAPYFQGYAVLVIGAQQGSAPGVRRGVEAHEVEDRLAPYLGPQFPRFNFGRISANANREVLFIIAQPPQDGQPAFPCHKDFQGEKTGDGLADGAIYVRGPSNTRPARAGQVLALVERARGGGKAPIGLEVEILGSVSRVEGVDDVLERMYEYEEDEFIKQQSAPGSPSPSALWNPNVLGRIGPPSAKVQERHLSDWQREKSAHIAQGRAHLLGVGLPSVGIRVVSRDRFVAKPQLTLTFHDCEVFDYLDNDDADFETVLKPILPKDDPYHLGFTPVLQPITPRGYPVSWSTHGEDVEVTLTPESFRPNTVWVSERDDYVILARDPEASTVTVSWELTEDGSDAVTRGDLKINPTDPVDAGDLLRTYFREGR